MGLFMLQSSHLINNIYFLRLKILQVRVNIDQLMMFDQN